jgi:hypothetical protein
MNLGWIFLIVVALLIGWFLFDRQMQPGETLRASVVNVKALPTQSGPPSADVTIKFADGTTALIKVEHPGAIDAGNKVNVRKLTRRISGAVSYELVR